MAEFEKSLAEQPVPIKDSYGSNEKKHFIHSLINKELLIQEAQRLEINREESFRRSVENFYEQSLIKNLMDRKYADLKIKVSERDVIDIFS